jgi:hypothetical protein
MSDKPEKPQKPEQPDTYTEFGIEWKRIEPVAKSGGAALWSIPLGSKKNNTMHTKHFLESLERLFASLMVAFVLGAIVGVLVPATRHITISVLSEAVTLSLTHMGTTAVRPNTFARLEKRYEKTLGRHRQRRYGLRDCLVWTVRVLHL